MKIRIGTRGSDLALWQARHVAARLGPEHEVSLVILQTRGDRIDDLPLTQVEGKAFFTAEIERALLDGEVDLAVHSHKDLPVEGPPGLLLAAVPARAAAHERLLVRADAHDPGGALLPLREGARVGTSSPRRQAQLAALRPDLQLAPLRGNVPTRVRRLLEGRHDAILLAHAGLSRLGLCGDGLPAGLVDVALPLPLCVPAPAQGALALQVRADDSALAEVCRQRFADADAEQTCAAERQLLSAMGGGCNLPLGAHLIVQSDANGRRQYRLLAFLGAEVPAPGAPARWAEATADSPQQAVAAVSARLRTGEATGCGPLGGLRVALVGSGDLPGAPSRLARRLSTLGAQVLHEVVLEIRDQPGRALLPARVAALQSGDVLAVTSRQAAVRLSGVRVPAGVLVAAVGAATAESLAAVGIAAELVGRGGARELAQALRESVAARVARDGGATRRAVHVLFPCAEAARDELPALAADTTDTTGTAGADFVVESLVCYRSVPAAAPDPLCAVDVRVYGSAAAVAAALATGREFMGAAPRPARRLALGPGTAAALAAAGLPCEAPTGAGPEALVQQLLRVTLSATTSSSVAQP